MSIRVNRGVPFVISDPGAAISRNVIDFARQVLRPEDREALEPARAAAGGVGRRAGISRLVPSFDPKR